MNEFFAALGRTVLSRWKKKNFALALFPGLAKEALNERPPSKHLDLGALIKEFLLNDEQPHQSGSGFGQPELIVFDCPQFYIQILFWLEGTTQIHQHEFSGAFHVLQGSSIHSLFEFENSTAISAHLRVGNLRMKSIRLLECGSTVPITSGGAWIHSLFHLDTPSLTVVIRTHSDPGTGPQFTYLPPHLAVDPFYDDTLTTRRTQLLDVLEKVESPDYANLVQEMVQELDYERGFFILQNGMSYLRSLGQWDRSLKAFQKKHGRLARYVPPTLDEILWRDRVIGLRSSVEETEHRFFLALLLNVPDRADLLAFVANRFPGPPAKTILRWARELASDDGTWILDAELPPHLVGENDEPTEMLLAALEFFLGTRKSPALLKHLSAKDIELLRQAFTQSSLRALVS